VLEALRNLLKEASAILSALRRSGKNVAVSGLIFRRIQELVVTWSGSIRPELSAIGVPNEVLNRADKFILELSRLASGGGSRQTVLLAAGRVFRVLHEQVLLEVARIPAGAQAALAVSPNPVQIFPEIPDLPNQLVPNSVQGWSDQIKKFLKVNPFEKNVFVMVAYRANLEPLIQDISTKLENLDLNPIVARDNPLTNDLYNPIACLLCCAWGVAIFGRAEPLQKHNANVVYELGMMQLLKRRCLILKHSSLNTLPTDLLSMLYEKYSSRKEAVQKLEDWWEKINA
jgi:hypothetical protein